MPQNECHIFHIFLLRPSHYDDDGYPITWKKSLIPSNSLATLNALCEDAGRRSVLGSHVAFRITVIDESNTRIVPTKITRILQQENARGFVGLVGIQTNQFPRALDLAHQFAKSGIPTCIGGFHVAGYLATMKTLPPEVVAAQEAGISFFTGEAENQRIDEVLSDAFYDRLKPLYNYLGQMPNIAGEPPPKLSEEEVFHSEGHYFPFDLGRGCPFNCSFCTIINVHGQRSRFRSTDDLEAIIRANYKKGIRQFFLTDDNIARNKNWESFFDRLFELRKEGLDFRIFAQVDTLCHRIPKFIHKATLAGIDQLLIGLESMNAENLLSINKRQNKIELYKRNIVAWKRHNAVVTASYIIGLPHDTVENVRKDVETIKRELPVDAIYFTNLTPLPGSQLHKEIVESGKWMDSDYNAYDTNHCVVEHPLMGKAEWEAANKVAWETFYTPEHMETVLRRMVARKSKKKLTTIYRLAINSYFGIHSTIHPIDAGLFRKKYRRDRRPGLPLEPSIVFYPKYIAEWIHSTFRFFWTVRRLTKIYKRLVKDPKTAEYIDDAIAAPLLTNSQNTGAPVSSVPTQKVS